MRSISKKKAKSISPVLDSLFLQSGCWEKHITVQYYYFGAPSAPTGNSQGKKTGNLPNLTGLNSAKNQREFQVNNFL